MADREGNLSSCLIDVIDKLKAFETDVWVDYYKLADNLCIDPRSMTQRALPGIFGESSWSWTELR